MKFFTLILSVLLFHSYSIAQTWDWAKKLGNPTDGMSKRIATDNFGNVYLVGAFQGSGVTIGPSTLINKGSNDILIVKADSLGNIKWAKSAGGTSTDYGTAITTDNQGNLYITGYTYSSSIAFDSITLSNTASPQVFLAKYDSSGHIQWAIMPSGNSSATTWGLTKDHSGHILLTGEFNYSPPITWGSVTLTHSGMFVFKFDTNGNVIWGKDGGQNGIGIATDQSNNIFVAGYFNGSTTIGAYPLTCCASSGGYSDMYIAKYDSTGNVLWAKSAGGSGLDDAYSVSTDLNGNAYVTGSFGQFDNSGITFGASTLTNQGNSDVYIVKYNPSGNALWAKSGGGSSLDHGNSVATDNLGNTYITGYFDSPTIAFDSQVLTNAGSGYQTMFLVRYNSTGSVTGAMQIGGTGTGAGMDVAVDPRNNVYFTGMYSSTSISLPPFTLNNTGTGNNICLSRLYSITTGINEITGNNSSVLLYPNPLTDALTISLSGPDEAVLMLFDISGKQIESRKIHSGTTSIDVQNLPQGVYIMQLMTKNGIINRKLIK